MFSKSLIDLSRPRSVGQSVNFITDVVFITYRLIAPPYHPLNMPTKSAKTENPKIRLIHRQQKWTLQLRDGELFCAASLIIFMFTHIHSFLAVTSAELYCSS